MADKRACWDASRSAVILANTRGWIRGRIRSGGRDPRRLQGVNPRGIRAVNVKMVGILVRKKAGECQVEDNLVETREAFGIEDGGWTTEIRRERQEMATKSQERLGRRGVSERECVCEGWKGVERNETSSRVLSRREKRMRERGRGRDEVVAVRWRHAVGGGAHTRPTIALYLSRSGLGRTEWMQGQKSSGCKRCPALTDFHRKEVPSSLWIVCVLIRVEASIQPPLCR